jgi:MOSC domain-containing protein
MLIGTVQEIWRYPVKSMAGERLSESAVHKLGIPGDRGWAVRDDEKSEIKTGTRIPRLMQCAAQYCEEPSDEHIPHVNIIFPDGSSVRSDDAEVNAKLSGGPGQTGAPVAATASEQQRALSTTRSRRAPHRAAYRRPGLSRVVAYHNQTSEYQRHFARRF